MEKESLISIIVPIYNTEKYLEKCLDSIVNQTYRNLEIILVNDGSTDKSYDICKKYKDKDNRIILINKENTGVADTRNKGLDIANGDYIGFVDSDDYIEKNMFEILLNAMYTHNTEIAMCNMYEVIDGKNIDVKTTANTIYGKMDSKNALKELMIDKHIANYLWIKLFHKKVFEGIRFPEGKTYEDIFVVYKLFEKAQSIVYIEDHMYYYVQRKDSIVNNVTEEAILNYINAIFERYYYIKEKYSDLKLYNVYAIVNVVIKMSIWAIRRGFLDLYNGKLNQYYNILKEELVLVDEGELIKLMSKTEKMSLYMLNMDRGIYIDVIKSLNLKK